MSHATTIVLDTNTVMALWWWQDPALVPLAHVLASGQMKPVARADTLDELAHVLTYRQFNIPVDRQRELFSTYQALCLPCAPVSAEPAPLPRCRDQDDQKFLEVARDGAATLLISRDKALLRLDKHVLMRPLCRIRTPEAVCAALAAVTENQAAAAL